MKITTKGEYALRALFDLLVILKTESIVRIEDVAKRQEISKPYLEHLFQKLRRAKIIAALKGPGGGYHLLKTANELTVKEVLEAVGDKPLERPKSKPTTTRESVKVAKILEASDAALLKVLNKTLGEF